MMPAVFALLFAVARFVHAMYNSQQHSVIRALQGAKKNLANELGVMHKIKKEVSNCSFSCYLHNCLRIFLVFFYATVVQWQIQGGCKRCISPSAFPSHAFVYLNIYVHKFVVV